MRPPIPSVEIAHDADSLRLGGPNRETATRMTIDLSQVSAKFVVNLIMISLLVQMHIQFTQNRTVGIGVAELDRLTGPGCDLQQIIECLGDVGELCLKKAFVGNFGRRETT